MRSWEERIKAEQVGLDSQRVQLQELQAQTRSALEQAAQMTSAEARELVALADARGLRLASAPISCS